MIQRILQFPNTGIGRQLNTLVYGQVAEPAQRFLEQSQLVIGAMTTPSHELVADKQFACNAIFGVLRIELQAFDFKYQFICQHLIGVEAEHCLMISKGFASRGMTRPTEPPFLHPESSVC
jgi:hypothetical protein